jgi:hypothetical protein
VNSKVEGITYVGLVRSYPEIKKDMVKARTRWYNQARFMTELVKRATPNNNKIIIERSRSH